MDDVKKKADSLVKNREFQEALCIYEFLLDSAPDYPGLKFVYFNKGFCLYHLEKFDLALEVFKLLKDEDPQYIKAYYYTGLTLIKMEREEEADQVWTEAIKHNPSSKEFFQERIFGIRSLRYKKWIQSIAQKLKGNAFDLEGFSV